MGPDRQGVAACHGIAAGYQKAMWPPGTAGTQFQELVDDNPD
jgi:hypothetical protein